MDSILTTIGILFIIYFLQRTIGILGILCLLNITIIPPFLELFGIDKGTILHWIQEMSMFISTGTLIGIIIKIIVKSYD